MIDTAFVLGNKKTTHKNLRKLLASLISPWFKLFEERLCGQPRVLIYKKCTILAIKNQLFLGAEGKEPNGQKEDSSAPVLNFYDATC